MYWQVVLAAESPGSPTARWLPEKWTPEPRKQPPPPGANASDTRSVFTSQDQIYVAMTEAILRLIVRYPGLMDQIAGAFALEPGQPRKQHFDRIMEVLSASAPRYPGLGKAITATLEPFAKDPIWRR